MKPVRQGTQLKIWDLTKTFGMSRETTRKNNKIDAPAQLTFSR